MGDSEINSDFGNPLARAGFAVSSPFGLIPVARRV
jgi:hypothetical protein